MGSRIQEEKNVPEDLTLSESREFYLAKLTYHKIQTDYLCYLHDLWNDIWGDCVKSYDPARIEDFGTNYRYSINEIWDDETIDALHVLEPDEKWFYTAVQFEKEQKEKISLYCSIIDNRNETINSIIKAKPPKGWQFDDESQIWETNPGSCLIPDGYGLDTSKLRELATAAMKVMENVRK